MSRSSPAFAELKPLGLFSLLALGINGTIGVGIFFAPAEVAPLVPGVRGASVFLIAALAMLPAAVVFARLGSSFAEDGGPYVWARAALGPLPAFCFGWLTYISSLLSAATVASGLGKHLGHSFDLADARYPALGCILLLALCAAAGLRLSALGVRSITFLKLLPLLGLLALGIAPMLFATRAAPAQSFWTLDTGRAVLLVVFSLQGFEVVPVLAGRAHDRRAVARATLGTLVACALLYALLHAVCVQALGPQAAGPAPLTAAARVYGGELAGRVLAAGQLVSALGIAFGQMVTTPHYLSALGKADGLGLWIGQTRPSGVPLRALAISAGSIAVLVLQSDLASLFVLSSVAVLAQYGVAALSLLVLVWRSGRAAQVASAVQGMRPAAGAAPPSVARAPEGALRPAREPASALGRAHSVWALLALACTAWLASYAELKELLSMLAVELLGVGQLLMSRRLRAGRAA
jgi:APA family basic amino acid/polyamine antiporter